MSVNKKEFAAKMKDFGMASKAEAERAIDAFLDTLEYFVSEHEEVKFVGYFGVETVDKDERKGRNPKTGEEITIDAHTVVKFSVGKTLKDAANF